MNLIELFKNQLTGAAVGQIGKLIGENEAGTKSALGAIVPTLLGSLIGKASQPAGASQLMGLLQQGQSQPGGLGDSLTGMLGSLSGGASALSGLTSGFGGTLLKGILGDKLGGLSELIGKFAGIRGASATSLIGMAAPLIMGMLGKAVSSAPGGLNASGLTGFLNSQADSVKASMPAGFVGLPGASDLLKGIAPNFTGLLGSATQAVGNLAASASGAASSAASSAASAVRSAVPKVEVPKPSFPWKWLAIPLLALLAWYFMRDRGASVANKAQDAGRVVDGAMRSAGESVSSALSNLKFTPGGIGERLSGLVKSGGMESLKFENPFAGAGASLTDAAKTQLAEVGSLLKSVPTIRLKITAYADGDPTMAASQAKADAIKAALTTVGVPGDRLVAEGKGSEKPAGVELNILK